MARVLESRLIVATMLNLQNLTPISSVAISTLPNFPGGFKPDETILLVFLTLLNHRGMTISERRELSTDLFAEEWFIRKLLFLICIFCFLWPECHTLLVENSR